MHKNKNNKRETEKQTSQTRNTVNTTVASEKEPECLRYATVAHLTEKEKEKYSNDNVSRSKVICQICGVEYSEVLRQNAGMCDK